MRRPLYAAIRARLAPGGRIVMNVMVANDIDPTPDRIAALDLPGGELRTWIIDEQFIEDRNAVIACIPREDVAFADSARSRDAP